jgi:DNA-binding SARP family transcriptional activator
MNDSVVKVRVLGETSAEVNGRQFGPDATHVFAALLVLALQPQHRVTRQRLGTLLWSDAPANRRAERLRWLLSKMRGLGVPLDVTSADVCLAATIEVDYVTLLSALDTAAPDCLARLDDLGAVFGDYAPDFSPAFQRWLEDQRESIGDELLTRLVPLLGETRQRGNWAATERIARAIRRVSALHEEAALALAEALCAAGDKAHGIRVLDDYLRDVGETESPMRLPAEVLRRRMSAPADAAASSAQVAPFVGRREQLHRFQSMLAEATAGRGGALLFCGPAGIGKTRLLEEAANFATSVGRASVVRARCQAGDALRPLSGLTDVIPKLLELRGAAGCEPSTLDRLARLGEIEEQGVALPAHVPESGREASDFARGEMRETVLDLFAAVSHEQTLVVQIDDFQWSDPALGWLWDGVLAATKDQRMLWCFGARVNEPGAAEALFSGAARALMTTEWLPGLEAADASSLLDKLVEGGRRSPSASVRDTLLERGGGIPLVLLELVRSWQAAGDLAEVPATLVAMMNARLTQLSPAARRTLQVSALLGTFSTLERLERVLQMPRSEFVDALAQLESTGILASDHAGVTHGHVLWAEAALSRLEPSVARVLHRHVAEQFNDEMVVSLSPALLWETARHWESCGQIDRALSAIVRGAEHLARNGLYPEAAEAYERAINRSGDATQQLTYLRRRIDLFRRSGIWAQLLDDVERHERLAIELDPLYDRHNDLELVKRSVLCDLNGPTAALAEDALACVRDEHTSASHRIQAGLDCVRFGIDSNRHDIAEEGHRRLVMLTPVTPDDQQYHATGQIYYQAALGSQHRALEIARQWMAYEQDRGDAYRLAWSVRLVGWCAGLTGDFIEARRALHASLRVAREARLRRAILIAHDILVGMAIEHEPPSVIRQTLESSWLECEALGDEVPHTRPTFALRRAILAIEERDAAAALRHLPSDAGFYAFPAAQLDYLAVQLGAHMLTNTSRAPDARIEAVADDLARRLGQGVDGAEWGVGIYAEYLDRYHGSETADEFVRRLLQVMRVLVPPRRLAPFVDRIRRSDGAAKSPEQGQPLFAR